MIVNQQHTVKHEPKSAGCKEKEKEQIRRKENKW